MGQQNRAVSLFTPLWTSSVQKKSTGDGVFDVSKLEARSDGYSAQWHRICASVLSSSSKSETGGHDDEYETLVTPPGEEPIWNMAPDGTAALKLQNEQTRQSVMAFEEVTPAGVTTPLHLHRDSDEVMYVDRFDSSRARTFSAGRPRNFTTAGWGNYGYFGSDAMQLKSDLRRM